MQPGLSARAVTRKRYAVTEHLSGGRAFRSWRPYTRKRRLEAELQ